MKLLGMIMVGLALVAAPCPDVQAQLRRLVGWVSDAGAIGRQPDAPTPAPLAFPDRQMLGGVETVVVQRNSPFISAEVVWVGGLHSVRPKTAGTEAFLAFFMAEAGPRGRSAEAFKAEKERCGLQLSVVLQPDYTALRFKCLREDFAAAWPLFIETLFAPNFSTEQYDLIRHRYAGTLLDAGPDPWRVVDSLEGLSLFKDHAYSLPLQGFYRNVADLRADSLEAQHKRLMQTQRMKMVLVGSVSVADAAPHLQGLVEALPSEFAPAYTAVMANAEPTPGYYSSPDTLEMNYISGVFAAPKASAPDALAFMVAMHMLDDRLRADVCFRRNLACALWAEYPPRMAGFAKIRFATALSNPTIKAVLDVILTAHNQGFTERELAAAKLALLSETYTAVESTDGLASATTQAVALQNLEAFMRRPEALQALKLTDVNKAFMQYAKNIHWTLYGNTGIVGRGVFER